MKKLIIVGTGSTAKSIYKFISDYNLFNVLGFVVEKEYKNFSEFCGLSVCDFENFPKSFDKERDFLFVAVQWNRLNADRKELYLRLKSQAFKFANVISPNAVLHSEIEGDNCWICDNVVIENDVTINNNIFVKTKATIAHYSEIQDHSFVGANSFLAGGVIVGEQTYIGISSTIFNSVHIGKKCLIGGAVTVKRHLPDFTIVKTKNDESIIIQSSEFEIENKLLASIRIR